MSYLDRREFLAELGGVVMASGVSAQFAASIAAAGETTGAVEDDSPAVFWNSGAGPGQTVVLAGHGLDRAEIAIAHLMGGANDAAMVASPEDSGASFDWRKPSVSAQTSRYAYVNIPESWPKGIYAVNLRGGKDGQADLLLNAPEIWWCLGDGGEKANPGSELRIFGRHLIAEKRPPTVKLTSADLRTYELRGIGGNPYSLIAQVPVGVAPGRMELQVHCGVGGRSGWSNKLAIDVYEAPAWPSQDFRVTDFGALGDSRHDDTGAFRAALEAAAKNHGGVVFAPKGFYRITGQLTMPPCVTLRGEDREKTWLVVPREVPEFHTVIGGAGQFAVEELSIISQTAMRIVAAPDVPSQYTSYIPWGDVGAATASDVRLSRLRVHHLRYAHRLGDAGKDPRRMEDAGPSTIALAGERIVIEDCVIVSSGMPIVLHRISHSRIVRNEFRIGRNGWYGFWGARDTLVEDNIFEGQDLEASYGSFSNYGDGSGPDLARLYIARNQYLNGYGDEREAITFDSSGFYPWKGRVTSTGSDYVTIGTAIDAPDTWSGLGCLVTGGRGLGQLRKVARVTGGKVTMDVPWSVRPDTSSTVAFIPYKRDVVVHDNRSQDASVGVQLWGGGYNFIIDGNQTTRSGGFWGSAAEYTDSQTKPPTQYFLPLYFTQWLRNEVRDAFVYEQGNSGHGGAVCGLYVRDIPAREDGGVLTFANVIRDNRLHDQTCIVLGYYDTQLDVDQSRTLRQQRKEPWSLATLVEGNLVSDSPLGLDMQPGFEGVSLHGNEFVRVKQEVNSKHRGNG